MRNGHYTMKEGFGVGAGLIGLGLVLQFCVGPVVWDALRWPVNGMVLVVFLAFLTGIHLLRKKVGGFQFLGTYRAAIPALVYVVVLTMIMGLVSQRSLMLSFWPLVLIYMYMALILGLVVLRNLMGGTRKEERGERREERGLQHSTFNIQHSTLNILSHLGLFLVLTTATLGSADMQRVKMMTLKDRLEWRAIDQGDRVVAMPIAIELKEFIMETYDDGKPKRFASDIFILTKTDKRYHAVVEVNKPVEVEGWRIYQYSYDTQMGPMSQMSIFELIRDPWLPLVYTGIYMMLAGAVCFLIQHSTLKTRHLARVWREARKHPKTALSIAVLITAAFFLVHHFMPILHSDTLVPALQSPWFRPHIIAYMLAYTLLASATVMGAINLFIRGTRYGGTEVRRYGGTRIVNAGVSLMTIGMLFGALWAKEAWGHYWSWDPKETWAAITWFSYLVYVHYRCLPSHRPKLALWLLLVSFVFLQMCWWGIRFLPSVQSVHLYN